MKFNWYKHASEKAVGYKIMLWEDNSKEAVSIMDKNIRFTPVIGKIYSFGGKGLYL